MMMKKKAEDSRSWLICWYSGLISKGFVSAQTLCTEHGYMGFMVDSQPLITWNSFISMSLEVRAHANFAVVPGPFRLPVL